MASVCWAHEQGFSSISVTGGAHKHLSGSDRNGSRGQREKQQDLLFHDSSPPANFLQRNQAQYNEVGYFNRGKRDGFQTEEGHGNLGVMRRPC